jgi:hypothetical protein
MKVYITLLSILPPPIFVEFVSLLALFMLLVCLRMKSANVDL